MQSVRDSGLGHRPSPRGSRPVVTRRHGCIHLISSAASADLEPAHPPRQPTLLAVGPTPPRKFHPLLLLAPRSKKGSADAAGRGPPRSSAGRSGRAAGTGLGPGTLCCASSDDPPGRPRWTARPGWQPQPPPESSPRGGCRSIGLPQLEKARGPSPSESESAPWTPAHLSLGGPCRRVSP